MERRNLQCLANADQAHALAVIHREQCLVSFTMETGLCGQGGSYDDIVVWVWRDARCWQGPDHGCQRSIAFNQLVNRQEGGSDLLAELGAAQDVGNPADRSEP
jgi:hypothetical protein